MDNGRAVVAVVAVVVVVVVVLVLPSLGFAFLALGSARVSGRDFPSEIIWSA